MPGPAAGFNHQRKIEVVEELYVLDSSGHY